MKKNAYADTTIKATGKRLKHLERNCNLNNPEHVKGFIATKQCSNAYKETLTEAYNQYCHANGIVWNKPFYRRYDKLPKIPTTEHLKKLQLCGEIHEILIMLRFSSRLMASRNSLFCFPLSSKCCIMSFTGVCADPHL